MRLLTLLLLPAALIAGQPRYARMGDFQGTVEVQLRASEPWMAAERNLPLLESTWLRSGAAARAEIELDDGSVWRIGPDSQAEIADYTRLSTGQRITLLTLDRGLAYFTGSADARDSLILAVPGAQITVSGAARLRLEAGEVSSEIAVLAGTVRFSSPAAELNLREGQTARVEPAHPARFYLNREVAPLELDKWSENRDKALAGSSSAAHVPERSGLVDLDAAGAWVQTEEFGPVWKPKTPQGWAPFRNGRWLWYDGLGYTWIPAEEWGWLPYHYGRWLRMENLGWIWAPDQNAVFKPGDVYWLRAEGIAGWGPLAPGEHWTPRDPAAPLPHEFLEANTTYAAFRQDAVTIDPAGFTARPKEPLRTMAFARSLPSPAFDASKLEARRPLVEGPSVRVAPAINGTAFESVPSAPLPQNPVVVITQAAPPPPEPVPVPYPVPLVTPPSIVVVTQQAKPSKPAAPKPVVRPQPVSAAAKPASRRPLSGDSSGPRRNPRRFPEEHAVAAVARDLAAGNFPKALSDLNDWTLEYPDSERKTERLVFYLQTYQGLNQPAKAVETGGNLLPVLRAVRDPLQRVNVLYLTVVNFHKLPNPTQAQAAIGRSAGYGLLEVIPSSFTAANRPAVTSEKDWVKARSDLEALAKSTIEAVEKHKSP